MPGTRSVALSVWVDAGSRDERPNIAGSSHFLEHLLFKGTTVRSVGRGQLKRLCHRRYRPPHFVIAAAGNVRHEDLCALVERGMDTGPRLADNRIPSVRAGGGIPPVASDARILRRSTEQAHIC